jgi:hypothetical protein
MAWVLLVVVALVALALVLRGPIGELRRRREEQARERKREARRQRRDAAAQRRVERAMNPAKAAARSGPPKWQLVAQRQGPKCWLCGTRTFADDRQRTTGGAERLGATYPTVDYVTPVDRGGTYEDTNVRLAHRQCARVRRENPARSEFGPPRRTYGA